jgi:hypothetical protein
MECKPLAFWELAFSSKLKAFQQMSLLKRCKATAIVTTFSDPDHVHLDGLPPKAWYERGVRILARTCLEAVKDPLGNKIAAHKGQPGGPLSSPPPRMRMTRDSRAARRFPSPHVARLARLTRSRLR